MCLVFRDNYYITIHMNFKISHSVLIPIDKVSHNPSLKELLFATSEHHYRKDIANRNAKKCSQVAKDSCEKPLLHPSPRKYCRRGFKI